MSQFGKVFELFAVINALDFVVRQINCHQLKTILQSLNNCDLVVRQIQNCKFAKCQKVLHLWDLVLMQIKAPHSKHVIEAFNLLKSIALEPNCFDFLVSLQIFDALKACDSELKIRRLKSDF